MMTGTVQEVWSGWHFPSPHTLEPLVLGVPLNVYVLPCHTMRCRYIRPHWHHCILGHREFHDLMLERETLLEEESRLGQRDGLLLPVPCPNLKCPVAMELGMPDANNLRPGSLMSY